MDELEFYQGQHTGEEIDDAVDTVQLGLKTVNGNDLHGSGNIYVGSEGAQQAADEAAASAAAAQAAAASIDPDTLNARIFAAFPHDTVIGSPATFPDGADGIPVKSLTVSITPAQAGSGTPSVDNVRLITGFTACNLTANGTTIQIAFPAEAGTVYLGELDVTAGTLTVSGAFRAFDGTESWGTYSQPGYPTRKYFYRDLGTGANTTDRDYILCSCYEYANVSSQTSVRGARIAHRSASNDDSVFVRPVGVSDMNVNDFKELLASLHADGTPMQIVCKLLTPTVYQLTPQEVNTILGNNSFSADCGDIEVEYRADPTLYIERINAPVDDDMIADTQIPSGKYFIIGGNLYYSTTTIPAGDTITPGSNCTITNLADALNALAQ